MICGSGGSTSRLAKAAGAELAGQMRDEKLHAVVARSTFPSQNVQNTPKVEMSKKCTPLWREAHFEVKMYKTNVVRTTLGSCDVEKVHAVVARSTFPSQNVQNTPRSDNFWKLRFRKSARRCGVKHISKSKCTKQTSFGPLLEVAMSKKCTPLWREAHFEVKMLKKAGVRTTFGGSDVEKVHAVVARSTFRSQKCSKHYGFGPLLEVQMSLRFTTLHYITLHSTTLQDITLHYTPVHYITIHYTPVQSTTLNYTTPHYITLHYAPLHYAPLHYTTSHYTTLHSTTLHYTILHYLPLHFTTLHYTTLHCTTTTTTQLHSTTLNYTTLHYTTLHYILPHSTTPHYITLHYITLNDIAPQINR